MKMYVKRSSLTLKNYFLFPYKQTKKLFSQTGKRLNFSILFKTP